jgi:hypothetical protein
VVVIDGREVRRGWMEGMDGGGDRWKGSTERMDGGDGRWWGLIDLVTLKVFVLRDQGLMEGIE